MASIRAAVQVFDGASPALKSMGAAADQTRDRFESLQQSTEKVEDITSFRTAREEMADLGDAAKDAEMNTRGLTDRMDRVEREIREASGEQDRFNKEIREGVSAASNLESKFKSLLAGFSLAQIGRKAVDWAKGNLGLFDEALSTDRQLKTVLANVGAAKGAYQDLKKAAEAVPYYGGGELLAGAAEMATYISDTKALESMMGTLANYAAGMSGGGELNKTQMVDYATQLGKALDGTYDGLKKKGFELTKAQEKIIEKGTDMEKALVLDEVISQSWAGLAEQMERTPEGKIIAVKNAFSQIREEIGGYLYPVVMMLVDTLLANMPLVEQIMYTFADAVRYAGVILNWLIEAAVGVYQFFADNWTQIAPIILGIVAALVLYKAVMMVATVAQWAFSSPLLLIIMILAAVIMVIYAVVDSINEFTGQSVSAMGVIAGAFAVAFAFIGNLLIALYNTCVDVFVLIHNLMAAVANAIGNMYQDPLAAVMWLFFELGDGVYAICQWILEMIDAVTFGVFGLGKAMQAIRAANRDDMTTMFGVQEEYVSRLDASDYKKQTIDFDDAYNAGYEFGSRIEREGFSLDSIFGDTLGITDALEMADLNFENEFGIDPNGIRGNGIEGPDDSDAAKKLKGIKKDTGDTAKNTAKTANKMDKGVEELKHWRDIAQREAINRFTTAEISVDMKNENHINSNLDLDGVVTYFGRKLKDELEVVAEGAHA